MLYEYFLKKRVIPNKKTKQLSIIDFSDRTCGNIAKNFSGLFDYGEKFTKQVIQHSVYRNTPTLLYSSHLFSKKIPFDIMIAGSTGSVCNYKDGYLSFKKSFKKELIKKSLR